DGVPARRLSEPFGTQLRGALEGVEVDIDQPEAGPIAIHPLEVVLRTPKEVPIDRNPLGRGPLQLPEASTEEHHTIGVVDPASVGHLFGGAATVLGEVDRGGTTYRLHLPRSPIQQLRVEDVPRREHFRMGGVDGYVVVSRWLVVGLDIPAGLVDVYADEVDQGRDPPQFLVGEPKRDVSRLGEVFVGDRTSTRLNSSHVK